MLVVTVVVLALTAAAVTAARYPAGHVRQTTVQGRTIFQWYRLAVHRRIQRDLARGKAGKAIRAGRELERQYARLVSSKKPDVTYAIRLASVVYGIPQSHLHSVGSCESHLSATARNGIYRGVMQEGPMFERGPFGQAGFSVWDPVANVMTAAHTVAREGWDQWECKP